MDDTYPQELVRHVAASTGLDEATATRVVADVVAYFGQTVEEFVQQRHSELRDRNKRNDDIWPKLAAEVGGRRFRVDGLSERQFRRIVYG
jgi:phosphoserine phosphatase